MQNGGFVRGPYSHPCRRLHQTREIATIARDVLVIEKKVMLCRQKSIRNIIGRR